MIQNVSFIQLLNNTLKIFHNYFVTMKKVLGCAKLPSDILSTNKLVCYYDFNDFVFGENNTEENEELIDAVKFEISRDVVVLTSTNSETLYFSISFLNNQNLGVTFEQFFG